MRWNEEIERELIAAYEDVARQAQFVASGGKNLKQAGWKKVQDAMAEKYPSLQMTQLTGKWKRLKQDWSDYHFLLGLSGFGDGFDTDKWAELDRGRAISAPKLSRFRHATFSHYDRLFELLANTMATGA